METGIKRYVVTLEKEQGGELKRAVMAFSQEEAVAKVLDKYFAQNKTQKVRVAGCLEFIG